MSVMPSARRACVRMGACLLAFAAPLHGAEAPSWRVVRGEVKILCPMTVGGSFEARTPALLGTLVLAGARPLTFGGDIVVDLKTLDTGIGLRDDHLRNEYLEVGKGSGFEKAVLSGLQLGNLDPDSFQGRTPFTGDLAVHGVKVAIKGQAEIQRDASSLRVEASFPVRVADHGIPKPQYLGVGVRDEVQVRVSLILSRSTAADGAVR